MQPLRLGIDVGGTFTDLALYDEGTRKMLTIKVPTTPKSIAKGIAQGLDEALRATTNRQGIRMVIHGTTVGTNTLVERRGATAWLLLTEGLRGINDVLDSVPPLNPGYFPYTLKPTPLIPGRRVLEVSERIAFDGTVVKPLTRRELQRITVQLGTVRPESVAICLLFSFMNPEHEERLETALQARLPGVHVSRSSRVLPQIREFPRLITTVIDAYIAPVVSGYLDRFGKLLRQKRISARPYLMTSAGGMQTLSVAKRTPVHLIESGPAAGMAFAAYLTEQVNRKNLITYDMGGTTAKTGLILDGKPMVTSSFKAGGWPLGIRSVDLVEIGAGGGSIAWVDPANSLKVGPRSAGALPGPACYGKGGEEPTVTDADLVLGYLNPRYFAGGRMHLDARRAQKALRKIGEPLDLDLVGAANGIRRVVDANMADALRLVSVARGHDPRQFALLAFGGAGPVHGPRLARELGIPEIIVPTAPGIASAIGLLTSELRREFVQSKLQLLSEVPLAELRQTFRRLVEHALAELRREGFAESEIGLSHQLDLRYSGQGYELTIDLPSDRLESSLTKEEVRRTFDDAHQATYGHRASGEPVEVVTYRLTATVPFDKVRIPRLRKTQSHLGPPREKRRAYFDEVGMVETPVYRREALGSGAILEGPCIIEQPDSTTVLEPDQTLRVDPFGNLILRS